MQETSIWLSIITGLLSLLLVLVGYIWVGSKKIQEERNRKLEENNKNLHDLVKGLREEVSTLEDNIQLLADNFNYMHSILTAYLREVDPGFKKHLDIMMEAKKAELKKTKRRHKDE